MRYPGMLVVLIFAVRAEQPLHSSRLCYSVPPAAMLRGRLSSHRHKDKAKLTNLLLKLENFSVVDFLNGRDRPNRTHGPRWTATNRGLSCCP